MCEIWPFFNRFFHFLQNLPKSGVWKGVKYGLFYHHFQNLPQSGVWKSVKYGRVFDHQFQNSPKSGACKVVKYGRFLWLFHPKSGVWKSVKYWLFLSLFSKSPSVWSLKKCEIWTFFITPFFLFGLLSYFGGFNFKEKGVHWTTTLFLCSVFFPILEESF